MTDTSKLKLTCYICGKKSKKTIKGKDSHDIAKKFEKFKDKYKCSKCGSHSFRWELDMSGWNR